MFPYVPLGESRGGAGDYLTVELPFQFTVTFVLASAVADRSTASIRHP
jgi:hypothetical protein